MSVAAGLMFGTSGWAEGAHTLSADSQPYRFNLSAIIEAIRPLSTASSADHQSVLSEVTYGSRVFKLAKPLSVDVRFKDGLCIIEDKALGIVAWGTSYSDALTAFGLDFACCWDSLSNEDDDKLTADARSLKAKLHNYVESAGMAA